MPKILSLLFLSLLIPSLGNAASFDCRKASSNVEYMICDDDELSRLDEELARAYSDARSRRDIAELKAEQRDWIYYTRNSCSSIGCLLRVYRKRIDELYAYSDVRHRGGSTGWKGEYFLGDAYLKINRDFSFEYNAPGGGDHMCYINARFTDNGSSLDFFDDMGSSACTLSVKKLNGTTLSVRARGCSGFCGARAQMKSGYFYRR